MRDIPTLLKSIGLAEKEVRVYLALLKLGAAPVRAVAEASGINRGTAFECLKALRDRGLVTYYHKATHQHFVAEPPEKLLDVLDDSVRAQQRLRQEAQTLLPDLQAMSGTGAAKPVVRFYEGNRGMKSILQDVLATMRGASEKEYLVYSASDIKRYLYESFSEFSDERIALGIRVRVISIGGGGELRGLDERRWLHQAEGAPTYIIIYDDKTALISVNAAKQPIGVVMEDRGIAETQRTVFQALWNALPKPKK